jgi:4-amino-4-deoxy-L-arabinose transferase-like glycosyltransferase
MGIRLLSPLLVLLASFVLWRLAWDLYGERVAFWSVLAWNLLPLTNSAALIMDGTTVIATLWIATLSWSWLLIGNNKKGLFTWIVYGLLLGMTTQVSYSVGWLLLVVLAILLLRKNKCDWLGMTVSLLLLALSWVGPIWWNMHHDWLQWGQITWGSFWSYDFPSWDMVRSSPWFWQFLLLLTFSFLSMGHLLFSSEKKDQKQNLPFLFLLIVPFLFCLGGVGHENPSFGLQLVLWAMLLPSVVDVFLKREWRAKNGFVLLSMVAIFSALQILEIAPFINNASPWSIPSYHGVGGVQKVAVELLRLRALEKDAATNPNAASAPSFIVAQTPELASLLGALLPIHYPELEGAPSVFTPESPSFSSQFQLWPHYADAVASGVIDPLYTEEPKTSPFIGHQALYITTELLEDLPETISGAFSSVTPVSEATLQRGKQREHLIIYECKNYQMLPL